MKYKNIEIHNVAELVENSDGSTSWLRVPAKVYESMELSTKHSAVRGCTGVELRFVIKGDSATIRMSAESKDPKSSDAFHVFRGGIQGGWRDHEVHRHATGEVQDFVIAKSPNVEKLRDMAKRNGSPWDPEVVRVIFDRDRFKIYDILGEVCPPSPEMLPPKTLLCYGSSITHGSNSIDQSHSWASILAYRLGMDVRNLGMAGCCAMEPDMVEYIASEGEKGLWDVATLELGINVLSWTDEKIISRVENVLRQVAGRNPEKPIFVISPFYHCGDDYDPNDNAKNWRRKIEEIVTGLKFPNVTYINGFEVLDNSSYMSADEVHPNIYGVQKIADVLTEKMSKVLKEKA